MWVTDRPLTHPLPHSCCSSAHLAELLCGTANAPFQREVLCTILLQKCVVFFSPFCQWESSFQAKAGNKPSKGGKSLASITRVSMQAVQPCPAPARSELCDGDRLLLEEYKVILLHGHSTDLCKKRVMVQVSCSGTNIPDCSVS